MEDEKRQRFISIALDLALAYQRALALFESGSLDQETFRAYGDQFAMIVTTPGENQRGRAFRLLQSCIQRGETPERRPTTRFSRRCRLMPGQSRQ
jgi:hypothetical protein